MASRYETLFTSDNFRPTRLNSATAFFHLHTWYSDGSASPEQIVDRSIQLGARTIVISDHDRTEGAKVARKYVADHNLPLTVLIAQEGTNSDEKHVLAFGLEEELPSHMPTEVFNAEAHRQRALTVAPHPDLSDFSVSKEEILRINQERNPLTRFDFVEGYNAAIAALKELSERIIAKPFARFFPAEDLNATATALYADHSDLFLGPMAGADAHELPAIDDVVLYYPKELPFMEAAARGLLYGQRKVPATPIEAVATGRQYLRYFQHVIRRQMELDGLRRYRG